MLSTSSRTLQMITQHETVTHYLLFILQPIYLHNLSTLVFSQPIKSCAYQQLLYLLTNQITPQGFLNFQLTNYDLTLWLQHRLLKCQLPTTVQSQHSNHPDDLFQSRCYCNNNIAVNCPLHTLFHRNFNIKNFSFSCNRKGAI